MRSVEKSLKLRVTFKGVVGLTATVTLNDRDIIAIIGDGNLVQGATIMAKHPNQSDSSEAVVKQIQDHSKYTVSTYFSFSRLFLLSKQTIIDYR